MATALLRTPPSDSIRIRVPHHGSGSKTTAGNLHQDSMSSTTSSGIRGGGDLARILEPAMKKLTTVESQRVLSVVDECRKKIQIVSALPEFMKHLDRYSVSLGADLVRQIEEQRQLTMEYHEALVGIGEHVDSYENLFASTSQLHLSNSVRSVTSPVTPSKSLRLEPLYSKVRSVDEIADLLKHATRSLIRSFIRTPSAMAVVKSVAPGSVSEHSMSFQRELQLLRDIELERLLTTQQEKDNQTNQIASLSAKLQQTTAVVKQLEDELRTAERVRDEEKQKRESRIEKLKASISSVKKVSEESNHRVRLDAAKQKDSSKASHQSKSEQMKEELAVLQKQYKALLAENKQNEILLRSKAVKREVEVENWINKYDTEMGGYQDELETMQEEYAKETEHFKELKEKLSTLEIEYDRVVEEKRIAKERDEDASKKLTEMVRAATTIQTFWRLYKRRNPSSKGKQKSGKKKGKGKGKKKK